MENRERDTAHTKTTLASLQSSCPVQQGIFMEMGSGRSQPAQITLKQDGSGQGVGHGAGLSVLCQSSWDTSIPHRALVPCCFGCWVWIQTYVWLFAPSRGLGQEATPWQT